MIIKIKSDSYGIFSFICYKCIVIKWSKFDIFNLIIVWEFKSNHLCSSLSFQFDFIENLSHKFRNLFRILFFVVIVYLLLIFLNTSFELITKGIFIFASQKKWRFGNFWGNSFMSFLRSLYIFRLTLWS